MTTYPFKNLVFRGGGILGISYLGALRILDDEKYNILTNIKRVSGASAGAITALVTSISKNANEIKAIADTLDFSKVPDKDEKEYDAKIAEFFGTAMADLGCIKRLITQFGWFSSDFFYDWLKTIINNQIATVPGISSKIKRKKGLQTFSDFREAGFRDLYVSVANISKHKNEIFSYETKPNMPVADAVRMSMSIPFFFESIQFEGDHYADGGTNNNYPMDIFDNEKYVEDTSRFIDGINWETLGCHLYTPDDCKTHDPKKYNVIHYIGDVFRTMLQTQNIVFNKTPNLVQRSSNINDLCISPVDFSIKPDNDDPLRDPFPDTPYDNLYRSGYNAMKTYLDNYEKLIIQ